MNVFCKMLRPSAIAAEGLGTSEAYEANHYVLLFVFSE